MNKDLLGKIEIKDTQGNTVIINHSLDKLYWILTVYNQDDMPIFTSHCDGTKKYMIYDENKNKIYTLDDKGKWIRFVYFADNQILYAESNNLQWREAYIDERGEIGYNQGTYNSPNDLRYGEKGLTGIEKLLWDEEYLQLENK